MRIGYLECFAGISGDMLLGALIDAGVSPELLQQTAKALNIGAELHIHSVDRSGIRSTKVDVLENGKPAEAHSHAHHDHEHHDHEHHDHEHHSHTHEHTHEDGHTHSHSHSHAESHSHSHTHGRSWAQIRELIQHTALPEDARALALKTFELLAHSEGKIHGIPVENVHFHEVGAVDTITDIVCAAVGLCSLNVKHWHASPVNVGGGFVECAHGTFPVPAPATADLLKGIPTYSAGPKKELVTPTGAALLRALECIYGDAPKFTADTIGYGAGTRNPEKFPNVLRLSIGEASPDKKSGIILPEAKPNNDVISKAESDSDVILSEAERSGAQSKDLRFAGGPADARSTANFATDTVTVLECAIDDASPQILAHTLELAIENGALDAMAAPVTMKKGRLGTLLTVLAKPEDAAALESLLFRETTTLGIRHRTEQRSILDRAFVTVETAYGKIRIKVAGAKGAVAWTASPNAMPEYEDCRRAAREHAVPLKAVTEAAILAFHAAKEKTTA
jgi:pyridinium-3,5-bisthiocarboxylic acid mononucleotide nickel chelatase